MPRIKQLPPHEAHKIAAGEVVERPANVVKELVENALDASATQITIYIEQAGKQLIRVVDNGSGMDKEDARLCFGHHATSKISTVNDLAQLQTFGFRGEALSSIAAISNVTLITRQVDALEGTKLELEYGTVVKEQLVACNVGTDISIKNLFSNVPARLKFLRTDDTEWRQILLLFQAFCLDYQTIHFSLYHNGSLINNCLPTSDLQTRISQLWQDNLSQSLIALVEQRNEESTITGAITNHYYARYDRNLLFFFVNKRWIKNLHLSRAFVKAYAHVLPEGKFPAGFIFIDIDPSQVDINVHPRKEEIQFLHPRRCETLLTTAIKQSLEHHISLRIKKNEQPLPRFDFDQPVFAPEIKSTSISLQPDYIDISQFNPVISSFQETNATQHEPLQQQQPISLSQDITIIGHYNKTYILIEQQDGLYFVDQHAAHERILYEQFSSRFNQVSSVALLFPEIITINMNELALVQPHLDFFKSIGLSIDVFGEQQLIVYASPVQSKHIHYKELINEIISWLHEYKDMNAIDARKVLHEKIHAQMACKAAVKAGDDLTEQEMKQLLSDLSTCNNRFHCPHGRPTGWLMPLYEIEKKFKRKK